jgi:multidrug efflux pump subunit AcrA (membrane-fusion protein)
MIPGYKSDKPGQSPMGMDLVPVYEENGTGLVSSGASPAGYAPILVTPAKQQLIGVKTALARKMPVQKTIRTVGRIAYDPELYQAQQEFAQAVQAKEKADTGTIGEIKEQAAQLVESAKIKLRLLGLSDELIQEVAVSKKPDRSFLYSDAGGTVWLYAPIYEYEIPLVKVGDQMDVEAPAVPGKKFQGTIRSIDSVLDPVTRSVRVRAVLKNSEGILKPEMYVNAMLQMDLGEVLTVPEEAVFRTGDKNIVFVAKSDGLFEPREVELGVKSERFQEIKSGISDGEAVVVNGNFLIDSESRLKAALEGIGSGGGHQHGG